MMVRFMLLSVRRRLPPGRTIALVPEQSMIRGRLSCESSCDQMKQHDPNTVVSRLGGCRSDIALRDRSMKRFLSTNERRSAKADMIIAKPNGASPLADLNMFYQHQHNISTLSDYFAVTQGESMLWTAEFICPQTGKRYRCGTWVFREKPLVDETGQVWYRKKNAATQAAAARALDSLRYEYMGLVEGRLCLEDPTEVLVGYNLPAVSSATSTIQAATPPPPRAAAVLNSVPQRSTTNQSPATSVTNSTSFEMVGKTDKDVGKDHQPEHTIEASRQEVPISQGEQLLAMEPALVLNNSTAVKKSSKPVVVPKETGSKYEGLSPTDPAFFQDSPTPAKPSETVTALNEIGSSNEQLAAIEPAVDMNGSTPIESSKSVVVSIGTSNNYEHLSVVEPAVVLDNSTPAKSSKSVVVPTATGSKYEGLSPIDPALVQDSPTTAKPIETAAALNETGSNNKQLEEVNPTNSLSRRQQRRQMQMIVRQLAAMERSTNNFKLSVPPSASLDRRELVQEKSTMNAVEPEEAKIPDGRSAQPAIVVDGAKLLPSPVYTVTEIVTGDHKIVYSQTPYRRPSDRILRAATDDQKNKSSGDIFLGERSQTPLGLAMNPVDEIKAIIKLIDNWITSTLSFENTVISMHRTMVPTLPGDGQEALLQAGKSFLARLGRANQSLVDYRSDLGVEDAARRVMNALKPFNPDADAYSWYLKCLEGSDPVSVAKKAETIVLDMLDNADLPNPNINTVNSLIQLWAQIGGTSGRYSNDHILREKMTFHPNRESLIAILSSSSYVPSRRFEPSFDLEFCHKCLERARSLDPENTDAAVYNAPLRWSGGQLSHLERPYARALPFDKYDVMFENGLQKKPIAKYQEQAKDMDSWAKEIKKRGMTTLVTYEALIQAWIRTRTKAGLLKAEEYAEEALAFGGCRLETFHPIVATWLHSNDIDSHSRITYWFAALDNASQFNPSLKPDVKMIEALVHSQVSHQSGLLVNYTGKARDYSKQQSNLLDVAESCTDRLVSVMDDFKGERLFTELGIFIDSVKAWNHVVLQRKQSIRGPSDVKLVTDRCLAEITKIFLLFERTIKVASEGYDLESGSERSAPPLQLLYLIANSQHVSEAMIIAINDIAAYHYQLEECEKDATTIPTCVDLVERITRRAGEFREIQWTRSLVSDAKSKSHSAESFNKKVESADELSYWSEGRPFLKSKRLSLLGKVRQFLFQVAPESPAMSGDIARIGHLISDITRTYILSNKLRDSIDGLIAKIRVSVQQDVPLSSLLDVTDDYDENEDDRDQEIDEEAEG